MPERFRAAWAERDNQTFTEGEKKELVLTKAERDPRLRQAALKKYGSVCMACGLVPRSLTQLDVHHKDPIAEGERTTLLDDVLVLCANFHRFAHTESPPLSLEALRE